LCAARTTETDGVEGREAIANFASDSIRVIATGRELNKEEKTALAAAKIQYQDYRVALSAVAVIANRKNPRNELRLGEVDSMFTGEKTRWPGKKVIDLAVGGLNSSTNEVFKALVLKGKPFAFSATPFISSSELLEYVRKTPAALGLINLSWLKGVTDEVTIKSLEKKLYPKTSARHINTISILHRDNPCHTRANPNTKTT
jgi:phosphate transport system substrate-binding protein